MPVWICCICAIEFGVSFSDPKAGREVWVALEETESVSLTAVDIIYLQVRPLGAKVPP